MKSFKKIKQFILHPLSLILPRHGGAGFTIIELIVVFSVIAILSTIGIASFQSYTNSQKLRNASLELKTMLQQARSEAQSQTKPTNCGMFQGYEVRVCCVPGGSNCPICLSSGNYELDALCSNSPNGIAVMNISLVKGISIDTAGTTQRSYIFRPITGGVVQGGSIVLDGFTNDKKTITVTQAGIIQ